MMNGPGTFILRYRLGTGTDPSYVLPGTAAQETALNRARRIRKCTMHTANKEKRHLVGSKRAAMLSGVSVRVRAAHSLPPPPSNPPRAGWAR